MKNLDYYNSFWYRFTKPLKRLWFKYLLSKGKLIEVDEKSVGIGKTYMMIELAIKKNIPVIAGSQMAIDNIKRHGNPVEVFGLAPNYTIAVKGKVFPNGVLIDDSVNPEMIQWLKDEEIVIRGGFLYKEKG
jgi:hypothetical protein